MKVLSTQKVNMLQELSVNTTNNMKSIIKNDVSESNFKNNKNNYRKFG